MNNNQKQEVAAFRYGLIAKVINRITPMDPGEVAAVFRDVASRNYDIPYSSRKTVSVRSLERYKMLYEQLGYNGLIPKDPPKRGVRSVSKEALDQAVMMRLEIPNRSVEQIIFALETKGIVPKGDLCKSTLSRYFKANSLERKKVLKDGNSSEVYKRFEASIPNQLWQSDFKHAVYLTDPSNPKQKIRTKLCGILDDHSRYIVHAQFYWDEKLPALEDCFKRAILKHGLPEQYYCDNGAAFNSKHISNVCARLGIRLSHSKPYRPSGRGKIERFFQFVDSSFIKEAYSLIEKGVISTLDDLNRQFNIWLDGYYHIRIHSSIKETPTSRFESNAALARRVAPDVLTKMFLLGVERQVDKAGCISLNSTHYDVGPEHAGCKVEARFDPFDLSVIEVWKDNVFFNEAKSLIPGDNFNNYSGRKKADFTALQTLKKQVEKPDVALSEVTSFLDAAKVSAYSEYEQLPISFIKEESNS